MTSPYDKTIGYSPLEDVDEKKMLQVVRVNKGIIDDYYLPAQDELVLVAGAGTGFEAALVGREYKLTTVGVDLNIAGVNISDRAANVFFQRQDISSLGFRSGVFSLIYCYHVLEHVNDHAQALSELERVLRPGGILFIGFPNKNRLLSYIGTSQKASFLDKILWNLNDYRYRLRGRFENRFGAHAGFTEREFLLIASVLFPEVHSVRNRYMLRKYPRYRSVINTLIRTGLSELLFPSNYYICRKR